MLMYDLNVVSSFLLPVTDMFNHVAALPARHWLERSESRPRATGDVFLIESSNICSFVNAESQVQENAPSLM